MRSPHSPSVRQICYAHTLDASRLRSAFVFANLFVLYSDGAVLPWNRVRTSVCLGAYDQPVRIFSIISTWCEIRRRGAAAGISTWHALYWQVRKSNLMWCISLFICVSQATHFTQVIELVRTKARIGSPSLNNIPGNVLLACRPGHVAMASTQTCLGHHVKARLTTLADLQSSAQVVRPPDFIDSL